jgi:Nucleotide modification associated domain 3
MTSGLLVRVGIDSTYGKWNAPCSEREFCYVPMGATKVTEDYDTGYGRYRESVQRFVPPSAPLRAQWPRRLPREAHFDPDFDYLTYGDGGQRAARIKEVLASGDDNFIVFYAGLRSIDTARLVYSIIGFYRIDRITPAPRVPRRYWHRNAHTRPNGCRDESQVVVFARRGESGRLVNHIPIGEYRRRAYRVTNTLLETWGGIDVLDGYIQRSVFLPRFHDPDRFLNWFHGQNPIMIARNNP